MKHDNNIHEIICPSCKTEVKESMIRNHMKKCISYKYTIYKDVQALDKRDSTSIIKVFCI
jgi:hypothetical protein